MLSTIVRMHKGEIIDNGLCKAFLSINEPPWIAVFGRVTVVESEFDIQVHIASGDLLVFAGEVRRFDGKDVVLVQYLTSFLSCQFCTLQTLIGSGWSIGVAPTTNKNLVMQITFN